MKVYSLNKSFNINKNARRDSVVSKHSDLTLNPQLNQDKVSFGNSGSFAVSEAEIYAKKLEEILLQKKVIIGEDFNKLLLNPIEELLAAIGIALEIRSTNKMLPNDKDFFESTLIRYKASLLAHPNGKTSKLQKELLEIGQYNPKKPSDFVDLTPNLARISLLSDILPKLSDHDLKTASRIGFMLRTKNEIINTIYEMGSPNLFPDVIFGRVHPQKPTEKDIGILPEDLQDIYHRLLPEMWDIHTKELAKRLGMQ